MRTTGPKTRRARRLGTALRDKDVKYLQKRNYPPGMHGQGRRRMSEFGIHHAEKQKAKWTYDVTERQFRRYAGIALAKKGRTGDVLLDLLERRLDNVVYRLGLAESRAQARQIVGHGFISVNSKRVNIPSYQVSIGDTIEIAESKKQSKYAENRKPKIKEFHPQDWLSLNPENLSGKVLSNPTPENTGSTIQMDLIVEHLSR